MSLLEKLKNTVGLESFQTVKITQNEEKTVKALIKKEGPIGWDKVERLSDLKGSQIGYTRRPVIEKISCKKIQNGNKTSYTADTFFLIEKAGRGNGARDPKNSNFGEFNSQIRRLSVYGDGSGVIEIRNNTPLSEADKRCMTKLPPCEMVYISPQSGIKTFSFGRQIDLNNLKAIQNAVKRYKEAATFIQRYFITPQEKENKQQNIQTRSSNSGR